MSLDFGKGNRSIAFNPTSAFPLDARCYFESLTDAQTAAAGAKEVGDTTTVYHYGMKLLVKEGETYTWYEISKSNTLVASGAGISKIEKTSTSGLIDTYTITLTDGTTSTFTVTNGADGIDGKDGTNGTNGTDGTDGKDGTNGTDGKDGVGISSIIKTSTDGLVDTYTITLTDDSTYDFTVTNGVSGEGTTDGGALRYHETSFGVIDQIEELVNELRAAGITANDRCLLHCAEYSHPFPDAIVMIDDIFEDGTLVTIKEWIELQNPICYSGTLSATDAINSIISARDALLTTENKTIADAINEVNEKTVDKIASISSRPNYIIDADSTGIYAESDFTIYGDSLIELSNGSLNQRIPLAAGDNVTFSIDSENDVVKISAVGYENIVETTGTSSAYEATVEGITELKAGISLTIIPHTTNTDSPTLNVNYLGAKKIIFYDLKRKLIVSLGGSNFEVNKPYRVMYNGSQWVLIDYPIGELPYRSENSEGQVLTVGADGEIVWQDIPKTDIILADGEYIQGQSSDDTLFNVLGTSEDKIYLGGTNSIYVQSKCYFEGVSYFESAAYFRNNIRLSNSKAISGTTSSNITANIVTVNSSDQMVFGSTACDTYIKGANRVWIQAFIGLENNSGIDMQNSSGGNVSIMRFTSGNNFYIGASNYSTIIRGTTIYHNSTSTTISSDRRLKNSIEALPDAYEVFIDNLVPTRYKYNDGTSGRYHIGYIAQEVGDALTVAGLDSMDFAGYVKMKNEDGEDTLALAYNEFVAILHLKIKKLEQRIVELERGKE